MSTLTFGIIKPDAVRAGKYGTIIQRIVDNGFNIRGMKLIHMSKKKPKVFMPFMPNARFTAS
ncbi:MAG: nucleoside-diphosphate kinase [Pyrinomonadaceae bacterium]